MKNRKISVQGTEVVLFSEKNEEYISLTDIARFKDRERSDYVLQNWMRNRFTIDFLGLWEKINNPDFNSIEFDGFKNQAGLNSFSLTPKRWIETTSAIGIVSKAGRYGGTFAHQDIAFEFASWISPEFKLYLIKEFQRLKQEESERKDLDWDVRRTLTKINYRIHTDAVKEQLVLPPKLTGRDASLVYATEAELLNKALFGQTSQEWKRAQPSLQGNMREYANVQQLVCLANLECLNAEFIRMGMSSSDRLLKLNHIAIVQMTSLIGSPSMKKLEVIKP